MAVHDLYSYRKRSMEGKVPDLFVYDHLPDQLKIQIIHIWRNAIGPYYLREKRNEAWEAIEEVVAREHGVFQLGQQRHLGIAIRCEEHLLSAISVEHALDLVEVSFKWIDTTGRKYWGL